MRLLRLLLVLVMGLMLTAGSSTILVGCEDDGPAENAGEQVDDAADEVQDGMEDAGDEVDDALNN